MIAILFILPILLLLPGLEQSRLLFLHLVLGILLPGLDRLQHLPGLLFRNPLLLRLLLSVLVLLVLLLVLILILLLILVLILVLVLVLLLVLLLILLPASAALLVLQHQLGVDVILLGVEVAGIQQQRLPESVDRPAVILLLEGDVTRL